MSQPVEVYPNTVMNRPSSHSNGSFGTVFIVLAVIVVVSAIACFLGRLCNRRYHKHNTKPKQNHNHNHNQNHTLRPREHEPMQKPHNHAFHSREGGDIEFGFGKGIPTGKPTGKPMGNGHFKGPKMSENGEIKGGVRFADNGELRAGV